MAGNCVHDASPSNSFGSDGEACSQQDAGEQPPSRGRSSFGDAPEDPMPSWEIDTADITCAPEPCCRLMLFCWRSPSHALSLSRAARIQQRKQASPMFSREMFSRRICEGPSAVLGSGSFGCVVKGMLKGTTVSASADLADIRRSATSNRAPHNRAQACEEHSSLGHPVLGSAQHRIGGQH